MFSYQDEAANAQFIKRKKERKSLGRLFREVFLKKDLASYVVQMYLRLVFLSC